MSLSFDSQFECGNATGFREISPGVYALEMRPDTGSDDTQWFAFAVSGGKGQRLEFRLGGTGRTNVPGHFTHARPVASSDGGGCWRPVDDVGSCDTDAGVYTFRHTPGADRELIAYHYPYGHTDHLRRMDEWARHPDVVRSVIGHSVQGRAIDCLRIAGGDTPSWKDRRGIWLSSRQHAAESPASFAIDGLVDFLLSDDPRATALRRRAVIHVVPMINPDGVIAGNYRDNILGMNLNRFWNAPTLESTPEVLAVTRAIGAWVDAGNPLDFFIDFHADSGAREHYAFHPARVQLAQIPDPEAYFRSIIRFLNLVAGACPAFLAGRGFSYADQPGVSYQYIRTRHGAMALIPEGGYTAVSHGPLAGTPLTPAMHRAVGRAYAIALAEFYSLS